MSDYTYWQNALAGTFGPIHDSDPQPGFWRRKMSRGGTYVPVAIWEHEGKMVALVNGQAANPDDTWSYCCQNPITEAAYHSRLAGNPWADEDGAVTESLAPPHIGDNNPPEDDAEILKGQIEAASAGVGTYETISDDETAARAQSLRSRLLELSREADKKREALKKPHFEAGKAIDAKFQPLVKQAKSGADEIAKAIGAHETRKARAAEEVRRKAEEERRAALAKQLAEHPDAPPQESAPTQPPPVAPEPVTAIRGAYGRAAAVKTVKIATVIDQDAAYGFLKGHKELKDLIAKLAQRGVDAGYDVPGVTVTEEKVVR